SRPAPQRKSKTKKETGDVKPPLQTLILQGVQEVETIFDTGEAVGRIVLFHEIVLEAGFASVGENVFPGNDAGTDVGKEGHLSIGTGGWSVFGFGKLLDVLDVNGREAAGIFVEIFDGIFSGDSDPAEVEFHFDEIFVARLE